MKRRTLLKRAVAGSAGAGLLAGCLGRRQAPGGSDGDDTTDEPTPDDDQSTTSDPDDGANDSADDDPDGTEDGGDADDADDGGSANDSGSGGDDGDDGDDSSGDDSNGGGSDDSGDGGDREGTPLSDGVRDRETDSVGRCLTSGETAGDASVSFEDDRVVVTGSIQTQDPCYRAFVAASSYEEGVYEVAIEAHERTDENGDPVVCQQCVGILEYDSVTFFGDLPDRVVVKHGPETVADETR